MALSFAEKRFHVWTHFALMDKRINCEEKVLKHLVGLSFQAEDIRRCLRLGLFQANNELLDLWSHLLGTAAWSPRALFIRKRELYLRVVCVGLSCQNELFISI